MNNVSFKSIIAFSLSLCMLVPLTANIDSVVDVLAIGESNNNRTELVVGSDGSIQKGTATSISLELTSQAWANATGVLSYWDNDLSELVTFSWEASFDENGTATCLVENLPENIDTLYFQVYYSQHWDNDMESMVDCETILSRAYSYENVEETTTQDTTITTTEPSIGDSDSSNVSKDEYGNIIIHVAQNTAVKIKISSNPYAGGAGVIGYWDNSLDKWVTKEWSIDNCDENGNYTLDIQGIPEDVTEIQFQVYYWAYWDNDTESMVETELEVIGATPYTPSVEETTVVTTSETEHITTIEVTEDTTSQTQETIAVTTIDSQQTTTSETSEVFVLLGDVSCDGEVKSNDLLMLKKYLLGLIELDNQALTNADINSDGGVKSNDLLILKKYLLGLIELS